MTLILSSEKPKPEGERSMGYDKISNIVEHPIFIGLAVIGIFDMIVQALTSGEIKPIHIILGLIF